MSLLVYADIPKKWVLNPARYQNTLLHASAGIWVNLPARVRASRQKVRASFFIALSCGQPPEGVAQV